MEPKSTEGLCSSPLDACGQSRLEESIIIVIYSETDGELMTEQPGRFIQDEDHLLHSPSWVDGRSEGRLQDSI